MFEDLFAHKKLAPHKLLAHGFTAEGDTFCRTAPILGGDFLLRVTLDRYGNPITTLTEADTGEEYVLYKTAAAGAFVGEVREAIAAELAAIAAACFEDSLFRQAQTLRLCAHAAEIYRSEPEFLWGYTPANAILRRADSGKWYAAILTVPRSRLGFSDDTPVEIVNLHAAPEAVARLMEHPAVYPAWHMNKKSWFTVILDGSMSDGELLAHLAESHSLAGKGKRAASARNGGAT